MNDTALIDLVEKQRKVNSLNASGLHYFIFDEVDSLSKAAQASLKTTLNASRSIFVLTTNNVSQLDKGVKDRCVLVEMNAATDAQFLPFARRIASELNVVLSDEQLLAAIKGSNGSFREVGASVHVLAMRTARMASASLASAAAISKAARTALPGKGNSASPMWPS